MNKINFQNGSSGKTPLNKTNMNLIQDNVENEFKKLINALSNNKETITGETLNITDSAEERIYEININGNSKQDGTPTPDTPIEIKTCGDNINLFDGVAEAGGIDSSTGSNTTNDDRWRSVNYIDVSKNSNVTLSFYDIEYVSAIGRYILYDKNKSVISSTQITSLTTTIDIDNACYLRFWCLNNRASIDTKVKVSKGTMALGYSQGCINEVISNKNILTSESDKWEQGHYGISGDKEKNTTRIRLSNLLKVIPNTEYYFNTFNNSYPFVIREIGIDGSLTNSIGAVTNGSSKVTKSNTHYLAVTIYNPTNTETSYSTYMDLFNNGSIKPFICLNSEANKEFIEHQSQIYNMPTQQPFRAIGDVKDTFVKVNNEWYEKHYIERFIFDGTETITNWWDTENYYGFGFYNSKMKKDNNKWDDIFLIKSNVFKVVKTEVINTGTYEDNAISLWDNNNIFYGRIAKAIIGGTTESTKSELNTLFKEYLYSQYNAGTPVYVDYILITPTLIKCTEEQSKILRDIEQNAKTYKNVTNIYSEDEVPASLDIRYVKDIEIMMNA